MVAMPQEKLLPLLPDLHDPKKIDAAVEQLLAAVERKEAMLTGCPSAITAEGCRAVAESIVEKRYATEFAGVIYPESPSPAANAPNAPAPASISAAATQKAINDAALPTAFETRNLGPTLEIEPRVSPKGDIIYLNLVAQRVELLNFDSFDAARTAEGKVVQIEQPRFFTSKATENIALQTGHRQLIAVHLLTKPENYLEVFIVQAFATSVK